VDGPEARGLPAAAVAASADAVWRSRAAAVAIPRGCGLARRRAVSPRLRSGASPSERRIVHS